MLLEIRSWLSASCNDCYLGIAAKTRYFRSHSPYSHVTDFHLKFFAVFTHMVKDILSFRWIAVDRHERTVKRSTVERGALSIKMRNSCQRLRCKIKKNLILC